MGIERATEDVAATAAGRVFRRREVHREAAGGVEVGEVFGQVQAAAGNDADPAPLGVHDAEGAGHQFLRLAVPLRSHGAGVLDLHLGAAGRELLQEHLHRAQNLRGLEAGYHARFPGGRDGTIGLRADDDAHVTGAEEAVYAKIGGEQRGERGRNQLVPR